MKCSALPQEVTSGPLDLLCCGHKEELLAFSNEEWQLPIPAPASVKTFRHWAGMRANAWHPIQHSRGKKGEILDLCESNNEFKTSLSSLVRL